VSKSRDWEFGCGELSFYCPAGQVNSPNWVSAKSGKCHYKAPYWIGQTIVKWNSPSTGARANS